MPKHAEATGQLEAVIALYWAAIGSIAAADYLIGWNALSDGLGVGSAWLTVVYLLWFVTVAKGVPEHLEVAFGA